jgi:hypothetical protein
MSRIVVLFSLATVLFVFAPRPMDVLPDVPSSESRYPAPRPKTDVPDQPDWETEVPIWPYHDGCPSRFDWLDKLALDEAIAADNIGAPLPISDWEEYRIPAPEPKYYPAGRGPPRRDPRFRFLREKGANDSSERGVALGLRWLARQQRADGGWECDGTEKGDRITATSLALLAFLRVGQVHKPLKDVEDQKYRKVVAAGIRFLLKSCRPTGPGAGRFRDTTMTGQALAALVLCEAYAMTEDPNLKSSARTALDFLFHVQGPNGSWGEGPCTNGDIHTTGWVVQAFSAAKRTEDLPVDDRVIKRALTFLDSVSAGTRKSMYGIANNSDAKPGTVSTATGLWCRYLIDRWGPNHPGMIDGVAGLLKHPPNATNHDPLYFYYATWVLARYGGDGWELWNEGPADAAGLRNGGVRDLLTGTQLRRDEGSNLGSWDPVGEWGERYGRFGTTALSVLTLEVYYRDVSLYKRSTSGPGTFNDK